MSSCIKKIYFSFKKLQVYIDLFKKISLYKNKNNEEGLNPICGICYKSYYDGIKIYHSFDKEKRNHYEREKIRKRFNNKLICILTNRTKLSFKSQNVEKLNKTFEIKGCPSSVFQEWFFHQLYDNMNVENYGSVWTIDDCYPLAKTNLFNEMDMYTSIL